MRFQLTMIARHFEDGLRALRANPADVQAAERAYDTGSRQLHRVPWERAWSSRLKELFQLQHKLRTEIDRRATTATLGQLRLATHEVDVAPASRGEAQREGRGQRDEVADQREHHRVYAAVQHEHADPGGWREQDPGQN